MPYQSLPVNLPIPIRAILLEFFFILITPVFFIIIPLLLIRLKEYKFFYGYTFITYSLSYLYYDYKNKDYQNISIYQTMLIFIILYIILLIYLLKSWITNRKYGATTIFLIAWSVFVSSIIYPVLNSIFIELQIYPEWNLFYGYLIFLLFPISYLIYSIKKDKKSKSPLNDNPQNFIS